MSNIQKIEERKLKKEIFDVKNENLKALEKLFPSVVKDGQVDFQALKEELGEFEEVGSEKYGLTWSGKQNAKKIAQENVIGKTLKYVPEDSKNPETTENLYIEGDNLEVLKLLRQNYYNSIKMIYIDPPYNLDGDFIYNDNYRISQEESDIQEGIISNDGERCMISQKSANRYHSRWLNMIYPRIKIAKDLLSDSGVMFISIDNTEMDNLKKICNEVFGEDNYVSTIVIELTKTQGMKVKSAKEGSIVKNYEYILCYSKNYSNKKIVENILYDKNSGYDKHFCYYIKKIEDKYEIEKLVDILEKQPNIYREFEKYELLKGGKISLSTLEKAIEVSPIVKKYIFNEISSFIFQEMACNISIDSSIEEKLMNNKVVEYRGYLLTKSSGGKIRQYGCLKDTLNYYDEYIRDYGRVTIRGDLWKGFYSDMMNIAKEGGVEYKNGKKPVRLLYQLAKWINVKENDIVLDFFSGSGTLGEAIMRLNMDDCGKRKYILIQIPENLDISVKKAISPETKKSLNSLIKFLDSIEKPHLLSEIGKERVRIAGDTIRKENTDITSIDLGFKVFRVGDTNIRWNSYSDESINQISLEEGKMKDKDQIDFMPGFTDIDVVYEILLRQRDIPLSTKVEKLSDIGERTYMFAQSYVVCLEEDVSRELIERLSEINPIPIKFYFRDSAFNDDIELKDYTIRELEALIARNTMDDRKSYTVEFI